MFLIARLCRIAEPGGKDLESGPARESPSWYQSANQDKQAPDLMESWLQDFAEEQNLVARMVHQLRSDDPDEHFQILKTARQHFSTGGPRRVRHTLPPLAFSSLQVPISPT